MTDDHGHDDGHGEEETERVTSPMQEFTNRQVGIGAAVAVVGLLVAYAVPFLV